MDDIIDFRWSDYQNTLIPVPVSQTVHDRLRIALISTGKSGYFHDQDPLIQSGVAVINYIFDFWTVRYGFTGNDLCVNFTDTDPHFFSGFFQDHLVPRKDLFLVI